jgi:hypothetical protein
MCKQLVNFITCGCDSSPPFFVIYKAGTHTSLSPIRSGFAPGFVNYKKGWTRIAAASDKVYQLLAHGRRFSPGTQVQVFIYSPMVCLICKIVLVVGFTCYLYCEHLFDK